MPSNKFSGVDIKWRRGFVMSDGGNGNFHQRQTIKNQFVPLLERKII